MYTDFTLQIPLTQKLSLSSFPKCEMDSDTGKPLNTLTLLTQQQIQALESKNTMVSDVVAQDRAVFKAIEKGLDNVNEDRTQKVCIQCNRHLSIAATSFTQPLDAVSIIVIDTILENTRKGARFFSPYSTWTVQILACLSHKIVHHYCLIQQQLDTIIAFLVSVNQGRAPECVFVALNSLSMYCHTYQ